MTVVADKKGYNRRDRYSRVAGSGSGIVLLILRELQMLDTVIFQLSNGDIIRIETNVDMVETNNVYVYVYVVVVDCCCCRFVFLFLLDFLYQLVVVAADVVVVEY